MTARVENYSLSIDEVKAHLDQNKILAFIEILGYEVKGKKFKLRDERTPSTSVSSDGLITDFGGDFKGDIFDLLQKYHGMSLDEAVRWVARELGIMHELATPVKPIQAKSPQQPRRAIFDATKLYRKAQESFAKYVETKGKEKVMNEFNEKLIPKKLFESKKMTIDKKVLHRMVGYDLQANSFTITLFEGDTPKIVNVQRKGDIKWWCATGSPKSFISSYFNDSSFFFVVFGIKEILLLEALHLPYIGFQSDGIAKGFRHNAQYGEIMAKAGDKLPIILLDNDESCKEAAQTLLSIFGKGVEVDFQKLLFDVELPKGYDFFDFIVSMESFDIAFWMIEDYIGRTPPYDEL